MLAIQAPINGGESGAHVGNLQGTLRLLLDGGIITSLNPADGPTPEDFARFERQFEEERVQALYGEATRHLVQNVQIQEGLGGDLRGIVEERTAGVLNRLLRELGALDTGPEVFIVRGRVTQASGTPAAGLVVRARDRDIRTFQRLGEEARTNRDGRYAITYSSDQFSSGDKGNADLVVRAFASDSASDLDAPLAESPTQYNAPAVAEIDLQVPDIDIEPSEFDRHVESIAPLLVGQREGGGDLTIAELIERDIDFLAGDTGIEHQHIAWLITAFGLSMRTELGDADAAAALFYGWFRKGLPSDWEALRVQRINVLRRAALDAIDEHIIPRTLREEIESILARIPNPHVQELATVIEGTALPPETMRAVLTHVDAVEAVSDDVLGRLVEQNALTEIEAQSLGLGVSLQRLTAGNQTLATTMLASEFPSVTTGKLRQARDLASLEPADWARVLEQAGPAAPDAVGRAEYARTLALDAVAAFPETAFRQRATRVPADINDSLQRIQPLLERNNTTIAADFEALDLRGVPERDREGLRDAHSGLKRLANLHPGLGLHEIFSKREGAGNAAELVVERVGWLRTVFDLNPDTNFLGLDYLPGSDDLNQIKFGELSADARDHVVRDLKAQNRIHAVAGNAIPAREIMEAGFHSASAIALSGAAAFTRQTGLPDSEGMAYHAKALDLANDAAQQWIKMYDVARDQTTVPIRTIPSPTDFFKPLEGFAELLNDEPWCNCEHCQSVLSPAAYFVDLMHYIERHILENSFTKGHKTHPLHLQVRRPDLWDLELTCKNTDEYVPYLDVVNEVLERYVWESTSHPVGATLGGYLYKHLAEQQGSFQQPFTLPMERLDILLGHFGLSRYDVARAMGADRPTQARARLTISHKEYDLITTERTGTTVDNLRFLQQLFRLRVALSASSADTLVGPMEMRTFLNATGLPHAVVKAILESTFVNTDGSINETIEVVLGKRAKDDVQNNSELVANCSVRRLDRIHRFTRLWRTLPWTVEELDYVLTRLALPDPVARIEAGTPEAAGVPGKAGTLESILGLLELNATWSLPIDELMALSNEFPAKGLREPISLFDRLFNQPPFLDRDGRWPDKLPIRFVHPAWRKTNIPHGVSDPHNNTLTRLLAGLQIDDRELIGLVEGLAAIPAVGYQSVTDPATGTVNKSILVSRESIGILYRHARLMRLLKRTVADFVTLVKLTPRMEDRLPADRYVRDLGDVASILESAAWQQASGFSLDEIGYVTNVSGSKASRDPSTLAGEIVARVKGEKSLEFADTLFTQLGLTDRQSRELVLASVRHKPSDHRVIRALPDGVSYCLTPKFDPATTATWLSAIDVHVDPTLVNGLLEKYRALHVLDVAVGSALDLSPEETQILRELAHPLDGAAAAAITEGLHAGDKTRVVALLTDVLRFRTLFKSKAFGVEGLSFVRNHKPIFFALPGKPDNEAVTTQVVRNVAAYAALAVATDAGFATASSPPDIQAIHEVLTGVGAVPDTLLANAVRTDVTRIGALKPHLTTLPGNPLDALDAVARCLAFTEQLGVSGETLSRMKSDAFDDLSRAAEDVFGAFRAKYPDEKFFGEKLEPFEDKLRARKRDGLVDFVVSTWPEPFADANKLYEYFLIDVLLEGCARTSRVVAAISSLQLYVHRVLMNLERSANWDGKASGANGVGVCARFTDPTKREEWYWRRHYRVWEANRKVFLYPENYIEPDLRGDKTPLFKELEDTLLQQEVSESNVHDAYAKYLTGFDEVGRLKVAGAYYDAGTYTDRRDVLHLFGVTQNDPPVYYHGVIRNTRSTRPQLSAWQKLTLQIPVRKVSPIVFEERLYLFWLETTTRPLNKFVGGTSKFEGYRHAVRIKYSTLRLDGVWSSPQSLGFDNGGVIEESRILSDPQINAVEKSALTSQMNQLTARRLELEGADGKGGEKQRASDEVARTSKAKATAETEFWNRGSTEDEIAAWATGLVALLQVSNPILVATAGTLATAAQGTAYAATGSIQEGASAGADVVQAHIQAAAETATAGKRAAELAVLNVLAGVLKFATVPELETAGVTTKDKLYMARRKVLLRQAQLAAQKAKDGLLAVTEALRKTKDAIVALQLLIDGTILTVRFDRHGRDHTEPLDNYKPDGWYWDRVYPDVHSAGGDSQPRSLRLVLVPGKTLNGDELDLTSNVLRPVLVTDSPNYQPSTRINNTYGVIQLVGASDNTSAPQDFYRANVNLHYLFPPGTVLAQVPLESDVQVVNGDTMSVISESKGDVVWLRRVPLGTYLGMGPGTLGIRKVTTTPYLGSRLGTTLTAGLLRHFSHFGAVSLLSAGVQDSLNEWQQRASLTTSTGQSEIYIPENPFDPASPYQTYFAEAFFHIPFLVASHLNSQQKFAEAQRWYHYIFDPTAADDRAWRYREFCDQYKQSLRLMLTDPIALAAYRDDPFNPHAIARTRVSAYQKSIVMKYIDNLLDWADSLFKQFTMESVGEATMLYVMAQDILGPRPAVLGSCGEGKAFSGAVKKTYRTIRPKLTEVSDFLIELEALAPPADSPGALLEGEAEKWVISAKQPRQPASIRAAGSGTASASSVFAGAGAGFPTTQASGAGHQFDQGVGKYWTNVGGTPVKDLYDVRFGVGDGGRTLLGTDVGSLPIPGKKPKNIAVINPSSPLAGGAVGVPGGGMIKPFAKIPPLNVTYGPKDFVDLEGRFRVIGVVQDRPPKPFNPFEVIPPKQAVFGIPANKDLLAYWGRVEDRLFKIRNCMDIAGVRRSLDLFAAEIDPRLLVRMKAAGLTLADVMNSTSGDVPPYRFTYLIEKARQYASTVQTLGSQLLSVIEKRDGEELAQLRTVHEQNLLMMRSKMAQFEIDAAVDAIEVLQRQKTAAEYKRDYFLSLCDVGLLASEAVQQQHQREASNYRTQAGGAQVLAAALSVIPDVGAPTAMKFGGSQLGAAGRALAEGLNALAAFNEMGASRAGIESSNRRRDQEWEHQVETAKLDVAQIEKQITAAEIKRDIAVRAREVHEKTIEQSDEVFAFFSEKFSNFGRYTLLSTRLHGLYRQAFDAALSMARMTEQAYRAERPDDDMLLSGKYWDTDNAGLLAGERLLADLQSLERRYIEKNYRQLEIEQTFSLAQHAPDALQALRLTGECRFDIPEWFFDLTYPGQYRRRLKAARLTIPCVTGPYTNVGATLHLERSEIRLTVPPLRTSPPPTLPKPTPLSLRHTVAIASSKAQYDSGVFDFTFRDERYMPFEGAGAISSWRLSLPKALRVFDYDTISDVMVHLSYTAEFSEDLKAVREDGTQSVIALLKAQTMTRVFSLRREFPDMFHRLISSPAATEVDLAIEQRHFPFFLSGGTLAAKAVRVRAVSPLVSMKGFTFALGPKVKPAPPLPAFRNVRAAHPAANEVHGQGLSAFELEVVLEADGSAHPGVAPSLTAEYLVKRGDIDPAALHDIILEVDYSLA